MDEWNQFNNWHGWLGYQQDARVAIWLAIDRRAAVENVIDAGEMHRRWKDNLGKQIIIPALEAIGLRIDAMTARADAKGGLSSQEADGILFELKDTLEPLRQALKNPPAPEQAESLPAAPIDLL